MKKNKIWLCIGYMIYGISGLFLICTLGRELYQSLHDICDLRIFNLTLVWILLGVALVGTNNFQNIVIRRLRGWLYRFRFRHAGKGLKVGKDVKIFHSKKVSIGRNCEILDGAVIAPLRSHRGKVFPSNIEIGNNVHIGANDRIASAYHVKIEDDVLFAAFVHITDHSHEYYHVGTPILEQGIISKGEVTIKRGAWLAFGCHVLSGVTIGEGAVVAANAVVTKDVPAYSVVAGNPAKMVKRYNMETRTWENV